LKLSLFYRSPSRGFLFGVSPPPRRFFSVAFLEIFFCVPPEFPCPVFASFSFFSRRQLFQVHARLFLWVGLLPFTFRMRTPPQVPCVWSLVKFFLAFRRQCSCSPPPYTFFLRVPPGCSLHCPLFGLPFVEFWTAIFWKFSFPRLSWFLYPTGFLFGLPDFCFLLFCLVSPRFFTPKDSRVGFSFFFFLRPLNSFFLLPLVCDARLCFFLVVF